MLLILIRVLVINSDGVNNFNMDYYHKNVIDINFHRTTDQIISKIIDHL